MAEEVRQAMFLLIAILFGAIGALGNYVAMKKQKGTNLTAQGVLKACVMGGVLGVAVWLANNGGDGLYHIEFIKFAFVAGFGGAGAETLMGKALGTMQARKLKSVKKET